VLRAGKMKGFQFRRQRPILSYIADFMCKELLIVIEVDGNSHLIDEVLKKDKVKQRDFENAGFKVLRFTNEEVLRHIGQVIREIEEQVDLRCKELGISASPRPRRRGGKASPRPPRSGKRASPRPPHGGG